ncbi:MAG: SDR family oxidoreductase [Rickettsiales bacterium]
MSEKTIVLVTGANRGIGYEVCRQLSKYGCEIILSGRDKTKVELASAELTKEGGAITPLVLATSDEASVEAAAAYIEQRFGRLDVLVNNAGGNFDSDQLTTSVSMAYAQETFELNVLGTWRVTQHMLPLLRKSKHGRIVNVSSGAGAFESDIAFGLQRMGGMAPAYAVSKAALTALTVKFAAELKDSGILVNAVCPGWTATYPGAETQGARPVAEGAASIVWGATLADSGPTGGFFRDGKKIAW